MNISELLHHEMMIVARARVTQKYTEPTFTVKEEIMLLKHDRERDHESEPWAYSKPLNIFLTRSKRVRPHITKHLSTTKENVCQHYISVATHMEMTQLLIEIDNACFFIFDKIRFGVQDVQVKRFKKYYDAFAYRTEKVSYKDEKSGKYKVKVEKHPLSPDEKKDAARYAFLRTIDENDQIATFGLTWRPDASYAQRVDHRDWKNRQENIARRESSRSRVRAFMDDQLNRSLYPEYEVEDGIVKSSYELLMGI